MGLCQLAPKLGAARTWPRPALGCVFLQPVLQQRAVCSRNVTRLGLRRPRPGPPRSSRGRSGGSCGSSHEEAERERVWETAGPRLFQRGQPRPRWERSIARQPWRERLRRPAPETEQKPEERRGRPGAGRRDRSAGGEGRARAQDAGSPEPLKAAAWARRGRALPARAVRDSCGAAGVLRPGYRLGGQVWKPRPVRAVAVTPSRVGRGFVKGGSDGCRRVRQNPSYI